MEDLIKSIQISDVAEAEEILKSAGSEDLFEKAKWNVGDTKVYQGITYEVGGFNAKGTPLWRKKKDGGSGNSGKAHDDKQPKKSATDKLDSHVSKLPTSALKNAIEDKNTPKEFRDAAKRELENRSKTATTEKPAANKRDSGKSTKRFNHWNLPDALKESKTYHKNVEVWDRTKFGRGLVDGHNTDEYEKNWLKFDLFGYDASSYKFPELEEQIEKFNKHFNSDLNLKDFKVYNSVRNSKTIAEIEVFYSPTLNKFGSSDVLDKLLLEDMSKTSKDKSASTSTKQDNSKTTDSAKPKQSKWKIGDTKVYQGVTYEVGKFNDKGTPLWRKKKR